MNYTKLIIWLNSAPIDEVIEFKNVLLDDVIKYPKEKEFDEKLKLVIAAINERSQIKSNQ